MKQKWVKHPLLLTAALLLCCFITIWLGMHGFYISLLVAGCVTLFVAYTIYRYILRSARAMAQLIWAIRYSDFLSLPAQREEHLHSLPAELWDELNEALDFYKQNLQGKELANWKFQRYMRDYMKTVKSLDDNVGRVLDYLEEKGMLDNTLVVYTSDQGFYMGEHGWFDKRFMYEESMRTPLIMRLPKGFDRKGDITEMVQNIDYAPTFLELAGAPVPDDIQGVSLLPLLKGEHPKDWRKALYYHFYEYPAEHMVKRHYGIRTERYKLIHFYNDIDWWELYDIQSDPTEMHNLYGNIQYDSVINELKTEMFKLQEQYDDPVRFSPERDKE